MCPLTVDGNGLFWTAASSRALRGGCACERNVPGTARDVTRLPRLFIRRKEK